MTNSNPSPEKEFAPDSIFGPLNELSRMLRDLDDRGLVLSLSAFAEDALGELVREFMAPVEAAKQLLEGFNAPLGTFSSRTKASFALGLISQEQYRDLEHLRKIRNEFAHDWRPMSLTARTVVGHVAGLSYGTLTERFPESPAEKVIGCMTSLLTSVRAHTNQIRSKRWGVISRDPSLIAGFAEAPIADQLKAAEYEFESLCHSRDEASGERRAFYEMRIHRFEGKVALLAYKCPQEHRGTHSKLLDAVKRALGQGDAAAEAGGKSPS